MNSKLQDEIQKMRDLYIGEKDYSKLEEVKTEIKNVYDNNKVKPDSEVLAIEYLKFFQKLYAANKQLSEVEAEEIRRVYTKHRNSKKVALEYISLLFKFPFGSTVEQHHKAIAEAKQVWMNHSSSQKITSYYFVMQIFSIPIEPMSEVEKILGDFPIGLQKNPKLIVILDILIDKLTISKDSAKDREKALYVLTYLAESDKYNEFLNYSRYSILYDYYESLTADELINLLEVWRLIQTIKGELIVRELEGVKFGHYTSGKVLQEILKQEKNTKYEITSKSRLSNVNYMNDPSEGKVLNQFLTLDSQLQQLTLKPSPWFLMSLTSAIDRLEMWAQYGCQAQGVCLILSPSDFLKRDLVWGPKNFKDKQENDMSSIDLNEVNGDFIYRIGYLSISEQNDDILEKKYNTCLSDAEIDTINDSLNRMKERVVAIDRSSKLFEVVNEILDEIRYLFKSADYSYESELRILKYVPLEADNEKIKINDSGEVAKIYIERDNPIKIEEVIFGPKFSHPENVTPLLHFLDNNIKFSQSKIPFK